MIRHRFLAALTAVLLAAPLGRAAAVDPYLPEDSESVLNVNVRQILDSALVKKNLLELAQEALRGNDQVQDVLKDLGFDPFKDLDRIIVALPGGTEKDRGLVIVRGRFDVAKFKAKAEQVAKDDADHLKIHKVLGGKHLLYEVNVPESDDPLFVALAGPDTLLASPGKDYVVDALKKSKDPTKPALKDKRFQALLEKLNDRQSLSLAMVKTPKVKDALEKLPGDVKGMLDKVLALGGGLTITDEVKLELTATTKNAKEARELKASAQAGLNLVNLGLAAFAAQNNDSAEIEFFVEVIKSVRITDNGRAVVVKGRITSDLIEDTIKKKSK
jgi:hypothetical protein